MRGLKNIGNCRGLRTWASASLYRRGQRLQTIERTGTEGLILDKEYFLLDTPKRPGANSHLCVCVGGHGGLRGCALAGEAFGRQKRYHDIHPCRLQGARAAALLSRSRWARCSDHFILYCKQGESALNILEPVSSTCDVFMYNGGKKSSTHVYLHNLDLVLHAQTPPPSTLLPFIIALGCCFGKTLSDALFTFFYRSNISNSRGLK